MQRRQRRGAGLLPAAVEEIKRLRAEWAALKDSDLLEITLATVQDTPNTRPQRECQRKKQSARRQASSEVLRGVVALVEVGTEPRALPLRAALAALGATVAPFWSPIVTHVVWSEGGDRRARAEARASAARVVSPLWVEACAASHRRLPEKTFPATTRPSDVPSPNTLLKLLKKAEKDNVPLADLLPNEVNRNKHKMSQPVSTVTSQDMSSDDSEDDTRCMPQSKPTGILLDTSANTSQDISAGTSRDTSASTSRDTFVGTSQGTSASISRDTSKGKASNADSSTDAGSGVNTNPRRALPKSFSPPNRKKQKTLEEFTSIVVVRCPNSKRKVQPPPPPQLPMCPDLSVTTDLVSELMQETLLRLYPERKPDVSSDSDIDSHMYYVPPDDPEPGLIESEREDIARAERIAQRRAGKQQQLSRELTMTYLDNRKGPGTCGTRTFIDRLAPYSCGRLIGPDHVPSQDPIHSSDGRLKIVLTGSSRAERCSVYNAVQRLGGAKMQKNVNQKTTHIIIGHFGRKLKSKRYGETTGSRQARATASVVRDAPLPAMASDGEYEEDDIGNLRTFNSLAGAARGCRVVFTQWAFDSLIAGQWVSYRPYAVPYLKTIAEKAYLERKAFNLMDVDYAYNIFHCRRVRLAANAENRQSAEHLLALCGAIVMNDDGKIIHNADLLEGTLETDLPAPIAGYKPGDSIPWWAKMSQNVGPSQNYNRAQDGNPSQNTTAPQGDGSTQKDKYPLRRSKNGRRLVWRMNSETPNSEVVIGSHHGQVSSKWVFDSVGDGRMRSVRKYISTATG